MNPSRFLLLIAAVVLLAIVFEANAAATTMRATTAKATTRKPTTMRTATRKLTTRMPTTTRKLTTSRKQTTRKPTTRMMSGTTRPVSAAPSSASPSSMAPSTSSNLLIRWKCLSEWIALNSNYSVTRADWTYVERASTSTIGRLAANVYYNGTAYKPVGPFYAHVHGAACPAAGAHVKANSSISGSIQTNELWFNMSTTTTPSPLYTVALMPNSPLLPNMNVSKSVVIHEAAGPKIACCDLSYWTQAPTPAPVQDSQTPPPWVPVPAPTPAASAAPTPAPAAPTTAPPASSSSQAGPALAVLLGATSLAVLFV